MKEGSALIVFGDKLPRSLRQEDFAIIIARPELERVIENAGARFVNLDDLTEPGSIYEASMLLEEFSKVKYPDGVRVAKSFLYQGFELWWINYERLFLYFCLPFTQYKRLLEYVQGFNSVSIFHPKHSLLFSAYLSSRGKSVHIIREREFKSPAFLPFGVLLQILLTILSIPLLALLRRPLMVFTGDRFEKGTDHNFRMRFIYEELRKRKIPFAECIRGLESWTTILEHAYRRARPVIYTEAVTFIGHLLSILSGGKRRARKQFGEHRFASVQDVDARFKLSLATQYLLTIYDDVWTIRVLKIILSLIGSRVAIVPVASERSFHTVLACKLRGIPTVGILHGVASRFYNHYEFMSGFDGEKMLSVDRYGVWSEWWRQQFIEYSKAYKPEQIFVSGPMRPLQIEPNAESQKSSSIRVLFVSEEVAVPQEVLPYLRALLAREDMFVTVKFRSGRDGFEEWLKENDPNFLKHDKLRIIRGTMQNAVENCDVAVGCQSTGVLEALQQLKVPIYFRTKKWGDYYELNSYGEGHPFFAENIDEVVARIKSSSSVSKTELEALRERYFGDPRRNGSAWVVDEVEAFLRSN